MIDSTTGKPVLVRKSSEEGQPYIALPYSQLPDLENVLRECRIDYEVDEETISLDGKPEVIYVTLERRADPIALQQKLDSVTIIDSATIVERIT